MELRDLQKMTVVKLREEALKMGGFTGVHGMNKQQLIAALAPRLGIDLEAASRAAREKFAGDKTAMKQEIRKLKAQRNAALEEHNMAAVIQARRGIKKYKRALRRMARQARVATV
jgi:glucan phosphorylase